MTATRLPTHAAWRHHTARDGFEVVFLRTAPLGYHFEGHTSAVEGGQAWAVGYEIEVDEQWGSRRARMIGYTPHGRHELRLRSDGPDAWFVNDRPAPELRGCFDVDLEASTFTNALPVHRMRLDVGQAADAPAVYVRVEDLSVERLEQRYLRIDDHGGLTCYEYTAPRFAYTGRLMYDASGLLTEYPGLAERIA